MLIPHELLKYGVTAKRVLHIGANDGHEIQFYFEIGIKHVVCFEPLPKAAASLLSQWGGDPRVTVIPIALGSETKLREITVTSQHGQQSTFLPVIDKVIAFGEYSPEYKLTVPIMTFEDALRKAPHHVADAMMASDCLVIDVQGMELDVLEGIGDFHLSQFESAGIECSGVPVYDGEAPEASVIEFMRERGFEDLTSAGSHGDVLFRRRY